MKAPSPAQDRLSRGQVALVLLALGAGFVARVLLARAVGLAPDEAYYAEWSEHLALGYRDHPPAVAWLIAAARALGGDADVVIRLPALVIGGLLLPLSAWWLAREAGLSARRAVWLPLATLLQPLGVAAGLIMTPDVPLLACWTLCAAAALRARRTGSLEAWLLAGLALGGALLSKHSGWLLLAVVGGAALLDRDGRRALKTSGPWLGLGLALSLAGPTLWWDATRGFPSLGFQLRHGLTPTDLWRAPLRVLELFGAQVGLLTPVVAWGAAAAVRRGPPRSATGPLLYALAVVPLAVFGLAALLAQPEANWPAPAHPALLVLALLRLEGDVSSGARTEDSARRWIGLGALTSGALTAAAVAHLLTPLPLFPPEREPAARTRAWDDLPAWLETSAPLCADDYEVAAAVARRLDRPRPIATDCAERRVLEPGTLALSVSAEDRPVAPPSWLRADGCRVETLPPHPMRRRDGARVRTLHGHRLACP